MSVVNHATACAVCTAAPGGFVWIQPLPQISILSGDRSRALPTHREKKRFCSVACQSLFGQAMQGAVTMNREQLDNQARQDALMALGDYIMQVGIHKPLNDYSQREAKGIVNSVLSAYHVSLKHHFPKEK